MSTLLRLLLSGLLTVLALGVLFVMGLLVPLAAAQLAESFPEVAYLRWPYTVLLWVTGACALVVIGLAASVVSLAGRDRFWSAPTVRAFGLAAIALVVTGAVFLGIDAHLTFWVRANPPAVAYGLLGGALVCLTAAAACRAARGEVTRGMTVRDEWAAFV